MNFIFHNLEKTYSRDTLKGIGGQLLAKICFFWFGLLLYLPVKSYGHVGTVSSSNHLFPAQA